jgi:hypothetical protein
MTTSSLLLESLERWRIKANTAIQVRRLSHRSGQLTMERLRMASFIIYTGIQRQRYSTVRNFDCVRIVMRVRIFIVQNINRPGFIDSAIREFAVIAFRFNPVLKNRKGPPIRYNFPLQKLLWILPHIYDWRINCDHVVFHGNGDRFGFSYPLLCHLASPMGSVESTLPRSMRQFIFKIGIRGMPINGCLGASS